MGIIVFISCLWYDRHEQQYVYINNDTGCQQKNPCVSRIYICFVSHDKSHILLSFVCSRCSFFHELVLPPMDKPQIKIPSKMKEALRSARGQVETKLREEQKNVSR